MGEIVMEQFSLSEYLKNTTRPIITRDGRSARIICTDRVGKWPIVALISDNGEEIICSFTTNGKKYIQEIEKSDLFFAPKKRTGWVNIYTDDCGVAYSGQMIHSEYEDAETAGSSLEGYLTTTKIEWEK